jgi:hypothetical protein
VLWRRPLEIFPSRDQTSSERVNALVRFALYAAIAVAAFGDVPSGRAIGVGLAVGLIITIIASSGSDDDDDADAAGCGHTGKKKKSRCGAGKRVASDCRRPTRDNPFMNAPPTDFGSSTTACRYADVKDEIGANFERGLVREVTDVYKNRASDRQFVTMPVTNGIPDTQAFRNFLFSGTSAGSAACVRDRRGLMAAGSTT